MECRSASGTPDPDQIAELQARADAGDRHAAGRLGELLARRGDLQDAVRVWAQAYGGDSPTTRRLAELLAEHGDLEGAARAWRFSDVVWQNPAGLHAEFLSTLSPEDYLQETTHDPEDWAFMEAEQLTRLLAERDDPQPRFVARWAEHEVPGSAGRSATWPARPFEQAKAMLISELRHNLSRWAAQSGSDPVRYTRALDTLEAARGPVTIDLPGHVLVIAEAPDTGSDPGLLGGFGDASHNDALGASFHVQVTVVPVSPGRAP
jgi:hypothetical protein